MTDEKLELNDVVVSSRIRLARNIADFPFVSTCSEDQLKQIETTVREELNDDDELNQLSFVNSLELEAMERQFLLELKIACELSDLESPVESNVSAEETVTDIMLETLDPESPPVETLQSVEDVSMTINEEDHLRITVTRADLDLDAAWEQINKLDDRIENRLNYAFSPRWGYLTACPANVGTGMRVSVLVHLPALALTGQIEKVFRSLQRINIVARGVIGDRATGDFFRISNQATLGRNEKELIDQVTSVIPALVKYERQARELLLKENREGVRRDVSQSLEELCKCDLKDESDPNNERIMALMSRVRLGIGMGLLGHVAANRVNQLFALVHMRHQLLSAIVKEDYTRASTLRDRIEELENGHCNEED